MSDRCFAIKRGREYVRTINPLTGAVTWTRDRELAKRFSLDVAEKLHEGIGRAVVLIDGELAHNVR